ncbi:ATP-binding protein [Sphingomonas sp. G-3-2-10]|uniref:tetratricopeptide repeat-containing sensor histidine kinase n=1 Tax=Sphingomonas sp. G-3-2-10 TaxID=2728838 RepID=UPI00146EC206|nr:ATP-binding protein [Sphingomonas sp. G-3-2-10]NML06274.1 tetratricopeptide repeat protein [Sphingomonas sp. G-3-2-10]
MRASFRLLTAFLALLCCLPAASAVAQVTAVTQPKSPVDVALDRARTTMVSDPQQGLKLAADAEVLARRLPEGQQRTIAIATARWLISEGYLRQNQVDKARPIIAQTLRDTQGMTIKLRGDLLLSLGSLQMDDGQAAAALRSYQEAYRIFDRLKEPRSVALAFHYLGSLYSAARGFDRAADYYGQAAAAYNGDPSLSLTLHNSRGNMLLAAEKYSGAIAEYGKALEIARQMGKPLLEARILGNIARAQLEAGQLDDAEATLARGFSLAKGEDAKSFRQQLLGTAASVAMERGDPVRARALIVEAFQGLDLTKTTSTFREAHLYAYKIFEKTGEINLALQHLEAFRRLDDEATRVATSFNSAISSAEFDSEGQKARIAEMQAVQERRTAEFQRTLFLSIGAAFLVVMAALAWGLINIRRSRNQVRDANIVLGETNVALEKALKAKTEFLATTSHEIRTPLNGILGMTQVMLHDQKLDPSVRDRIGIVHGAGMTMRSLVDDILDVAKMETGNLTVDAAPMDLCATLKDVTRMWEEQARAKGLAFNLHLEDAPRWIVSDAGRLRQIVFNLLSNAIKFTEAGGVSVRATAAGEGESQRLKLVITDTGIGIPAEKRDEIFESFKQADSGTTRKFGGTGLGLTICRNLARAMGGDIAVDGAEGSGSAFTVDLPLVHAEAPEAEASSGATGTMLILDRNPIARSMLKTLFEPRVGALKFLATPDEALEALKAGGATRLLIDESTLKAAGDDPFGVLAALSAAASEAGASSAILWMKPDEAVMTSLKGSNVGQVIEKPVAGAALVEAITQQAEENSDKPGSGPLVSRAA